MTDPEDESRTCPACGEEVNHWIDNGYRNTWPLKRLVEDGQRLVVCTTAESDQMYVHIEEGA